MSNISTKIISLTSGIKERAEETDSKQQEQKVQQTETEEYFR